MSDEKSKEKAENSSELEAGSNVRESAADLDEKFQLQDQDDKALKVTIPTDETDLGPVVSQREESLFDDEGSQTLEASSELETTDPIFADKNTGEISFVEELTLEGQIEAVLFASPKPLKIQEILEIVQDDEDSITRSTVENLVTTLKTMYDERAGGFYLHYEPHEGYCFQTAVAASGLMERMFASRPRPLSRAALETLSIIAYRQPATRADVEFVRGVDAGSIIKNLLDRDLIACVGRKEDSGRPMLFGTTPEFLKVFRLKHLNELPSLASFQVPIETRQEADAIVEAEEVDVEDFIGDEAVNNPGESEVEKGEEVNMEDVSAEIELSDESNEDHASLVQDSQKTREITGASVNAEAIDIDSPDNKEDETEGQDLEFDLDDFDDINDLDNPEDSK